MSLHGRKHGEVSNKTVLTHLADGRRRRILAVLRAAAEPIDERTLAEEVAAREATTSDATTVDRARVRLRHVHLPALEDAGLVEWYDSSVDLTNHPALREPAVIRLIETESEECDDVIESLAHERRRHVLAVLEECDGSLPGAVLAREVAARERGEEPSTDEVEAVRCSLYHGHLPKLRDAELIEYDPDADSVAYRGHPELAPRWFRARPCDRSSAGQSGVVY